MTPNASRYSIRRRVKSEESIDSNVDDRDITSLASDIMLQNGVHTPSSSDNETITSFDRTITSDASATNHLHMDYSFPSPRSRAGNEESSPTKDILFSTTLPPFEIHKETESKTWFRKGRGDSKAKVELDEHFFRQFDVYDDDDKKTSDKKDDESACFPFSNIAKWCVSLLTFCGVVCRGTTCCSTTVRRINAS
uniref:Uncharacterized protein n=1 Tax=Leptocylindrus danicus TaxID=163516 RepID=A0A7S2PNT1_9STRA